MRHHNLPQANITFAKQIYHREAISPAVRPISLFQFIGTINWNSDIGLTAGEIAARWNICFANVKFACGKLWCRLRDYLKLCWNNALFQHTITPAQLGYHCEAISLGASQISLAEGEYNYSSLSLLRSDKPELSTLNSQFLIPWLLE